MIQGIGCDILKIERLKHIITTTPAFLNRTYSKNELAEYQKRNCDIYYLATRFAAKEAIVKALSQYNNDLNSIEILNDDLGKPYVVIQGKQQSQIQISLSFETDYAIAYAVLSSI